MSVPSADAAISFTATGYTDGLGRRALSFDRESGEILERLCLRPELFAFEHVLQQTIAKFSALEDERFARPRRLESDADGGLSVISDFVGGLRLSDALDIAAEATLAPGLDAALGLLLELLPAIGSLHSAMSIAHGAIGPGRVLFTPEGTLAIVDSIYAAPLERLRFTPRRLWDEFGIAVRDGASARFDAAADLAHSALAATALMIGRPLSERPAGSSLSSLRREISDVAQIRGSSTFGAAVGRLFDRLLTVPGASPYGSADEAVLDLRQLLRRELGIDACRAALKEFLMQVEAAGAELAEAEFSQLQRLGAAQAETQRTKAARFATELAEAARREAERVEADRLEGDRRERERLEADRRMRERLDAERKERERIEALRHEQERLEAERKERERLEAERRERERQEAERRERERLEAERKERDRLEALRRERERLEAERKERERLEALRQEQERLEAERKERERLEAERKERDRLEALRREQKRLEAERKERERQEAERRERERVEAERREAERRERERLEAERRERARIEAERKERERQEAERRERERLEAERRERERMEAERRERERLEAERRESERRERDRVDGERREREKAEAERRERARLEIERERERLAAERREREREEAERAAAAAKAAAAQNTAASQTAEQDAESEDSESQRGGARRKRDRSARARKDRLRSIGQPPSPPPEAPAPAPRSGWLIPPDRAAKFEPPVDDAPRPAPPPTTFVPPPAPPPPPAPSWSAVAPPTFPSPHPAAPAATPPYGVRRPPAPIAPSVPAVQVEPAGGSIYGTPGSFAPIAPSTPIRLKDAPGAATPIRLRADAPAHTPAVRPRAERPVRDPFPSHTSLFNEQPAAEQTPKLPWKLAGAVLGLLAIGLTVAHFMTSSPDPDAAAAKKAAPVSAPPPPAKASGNGTTGEIAVTTEPEGVRVLIDGREAGTSPVTIPNLTPGRHVVTIFGNAGAVKRTIRVEAGKVATVDVPVYSGWVAISSPIVLTVSEKGKSLGTTEQDRILLGPGHHELSLVNKDLGYSVTLPVEIDGGEVKPVALDPRGSVNMNAVPWAEVFVDGKKVGDTPIANLQLTLGVREIVFKNPQYGERKVSATITATGTPAVSVDFTKQ